MPLRRRPVDERDRSRRPRLRVVRCAAEVVMERILVDVSVAALLLLGAVVGQRSTSRPAAKELAAFAWLAGAWEAKTIASAV